MLEDVYVTQSEFDGSIALTKPNSFPVGTITEHPSAPLISREEETESLSVSGLGQVTPKDEVLEELEEIYPANQADTLDSTDSPIHKVDDLAAAEFPDIPVKDEVDTPDFLDFGEQSLVLSNTSASEDICQDLPQLPIYVELTQEQQESVRKLTISRIIDTYKHLYTTNCSQIRLELLARLVAQVID